MTQKQQLIKYFRIYCKFLSIDLYTSTRPPNNKLNGERGGRNIILLYKFFEVFYNIYNEEYDTKIIDDNIESLEKAIDEHIRVSIKVDGLQKLLSCEKINSVNIDNNQVMDILNPKNKYLFDEFYKIVKVFKKHINQYPEIKAHFSRKDMQPILGQGLIEFHNSMSHLSFVAREKVCENGNVKKAMSHIYRGILDNIKAIIKNLNLDDEQRKLLVNVRAYEFNTLGIPVQKEQDKNQKEEVLKMYTEVLLDLLSGFPKNKVYKQKVLTRKELGARTVNNRQPKSKK